MRWKRGETRQRRPGGTGGGMGGGTGAAAYSLVTWDALSARQRNSGALSLSSCISLLAPLLLYDVMLRLFCFGLVLCLNMTRV